MINYTVYIIILLILVFVFVIAAKAMRRGIKAKQKLTKKLEELEKQPQFQAEKKGQISESLRLTEKEKQENEVVIEETDIKIINFN